MKRVFIVHGWGDTPEKGWLPWLKRELEEKRFQVVVPQLPDTDTPRIHNWVPALAQAVGEADAETYFVGHSMGCKTIALYLQSLPERVRVGGAVFVAGFFKRLTNIEDEPGASDTVEHWLETSIDLGKVKSHLSASVAIFSDDDPYVPLDNQDDFRDKLGSEVVIEHHKSHFNEGAGIFELPSALGSVLKLSN